MIVIGISGKAGSGKDTTALMIKEILEKDGKKCKIVGLADNLKARYCFINDLDGSLMTRGSEDYEFKCKHRKGLIEYGMNEKVIWGSDIWCRRLLEADYPEDLQVLIIPDIRYPVEVEFFSYSGISFHLIRINRNIDTGTDASGSKEPSISLTLDASETSLDDHPFKFVIDNNGTKEELTAKVEDVISVILS